MPQQDVPAGARPVGCLVRLSWLVFGNFVLLLSLLSILRAPSQSLTAADAIYLAAIAALIALRYVDVCYFAGTKSTGEPATLADWRAYAVRVVVLAGGLWGLVRLGTWLWGTT